MLAGRGAMTVLLLAVAVLAASGGALEAQEPAAPQAVSAEALQAAIDKLGDLDYATRTTASRTVRRTAPAQAVPALLRAVAEHADGFVRYRALVLLTGFNDPRTQRRDAGIARQPERPAADGRLQLLRAHPRSRDDP